MNYKMYKWCWLIPFDHRDHHSGCPQVCPSCRTASFLASVMVALTAQGSRTGVWIKVQRINFSLAYRDLFKWVVKWVVLCSIDDAAVCATKKEKLSSNPEAILRHSQVMVTAQRAFLSILTKLCKALRHFRLWSRHSGTDVQRSRRQKPVIAALHRIFWLV